MKKIIILALAIMLVGAGCTKTPKQKAPVSNNREQLPQEQQSQPEPPKPRFESIYSAEEVAKLEKILEEKSKEVGFTLHYPTYVPNYARLTEKDISIDTTGTSTEVIFKLAGSVVKENLENKKTTTSTVMIVMRQRKNEPEIPPDFFQNNKAKFFDGYMKTMAKEDGSGNYFCLLVKDGTVIKITANIKDMDEDSFSKIAESIK